MENVSRYERVIDIADVERAISGKIYPQNTTIIALSATKGQVDITLEDGEIESRYAAVVPHKENDAYYVYCAIQAVFGEFTAKYQTGINIKIEELKHLIIPVYDMEKEKMIAKSFRNINKAIEEEEKAVENYKSQKKYWLDKMFC